MSPELVKNNQHEREEMSAMQEMQRLLKPATDENDSPVLQREYDRLKKIEAMAMACDGVDMGRYYEVPTDAWEALNAAVWDDMVNAEVKGGDK